MSNMQDAVAAYIALRNKKKALQQRHKEELTPYNERMERLEDWFLQYLHKQQAQNVKTSKGTVYLTETARATVKDWAALRDFVIENDLVDMLEQRVSVAAVEEYLAANEELPPGVELTRQTNARVKR